MNINWDYIVEIIPLYKKAGILTLKLGLWGILLSTVVGIICSLIQYFKIPILKKIVLIYIEISRNTPLLIQLFFLYYGLPKIGITIPAEICAIMGLTFLGGSYMSEGFRSGLEAVSIYQIEGGKAIGLSKMQLIKYVILPQAISYSLPVLGANCIFLLKETSIFSGIAIIDLMNVTKDLIGISYNTNENLLLLVIFYLIILVPISVLLTFLERRVRHGTFGN